MFQYNCVGRKLSNEPSPIKVLSDTDRGDDVQRRFRYQAAIAASLSLALLDVDSEITEIFCEQHEDILVRRRDDTFIGVQVKTRDPSLGPFTFGDAAIQETLERFVRIEEKFPNKFVRYVIRANCGFWQKRNSVHNITHCVDRIRDCQDRGFSIDEDIAKVILDFADKVNSSEEVVTSVLKKLFVEKSPDLEGYQGYLSELIANKTGKTSEMYDALIETAEALINTMWTAASLPHNSAKEAYFILLDDPETARVEETIKAKRITREIVEQVINQSLVSYSMLTTARALDVMKLPKGIRKMELKMAEGGFSVRNVEIARNHKLSVDALLAQWIYKYGTEVTNRRYQHLSVIAETACQEAYDETQTKGKKFGENMLKDLRIRIDRRYSNEIQNRFPDFTYEHMLGIVGILTEECKVWWSEQFNIEGGSS